MPKRKVRVKKSSTGSSRPKQSSKKGTAPRSRRSVFSVRQLPTAKRSTFVGYLKDISKNWEDLQSLKEPNEYWGFEIGDDKKRYRSFAVYDDLGAVANKLMSYQDVKDSGAKGGKKFEGLVNAVRFVRFKGTPSQWSKAKKKETAERKATISKLEKELSKERKARKKAEKKLTKADKKKSQKLSGLKRTATAKRGDHGKKSANRKRTHSATSKKANSRKAASKKRATGKSKGKTGRKK